MFYNIAGELTNIQGNTKEVINNYLQNCSVYINRQKSFYSDIKKMVDLQKIKSAEDLLENHTVVVHLNY